MTGVIATIPRIQFSSALGLPLAGGKLYTYLAGTTTPEKTYQNEDLTTENENPVPLDSTGSCMLWLDPAKRYKFLLKSELGVTQPGWPVDNISGAATVFSLASTLAQYVKFSDLAAPDGVDLVGNAADIRDINAVTGSDIMGHRQGAQAVTTTVGAQLRALTYRGNKLTAFGDSYTYGIDSSGSYTTENYINFISRATGLPVTNKAISGGLVIDLGSNYYNTVTGPDDVFITMTGYNDGRVYGSSANGLETYRGGLRAMLTWLGLPANAKILASSSAMIYTGTWSVLGSVYANKSTSKFTLTPGSTALTYVKGDTVYIGHTRSTSTPAVFRVEIDGRDYGTFTNTAWSASSLGMTYGPDMLRISGLQSTKQHSVKITHVSGGQFYLDYIAGNGGANVYYPCPAVFSGNAVRMLDYSHELSSDAVVDMYNQIHREVVAELVRDGLNIMYVDVSSGYDPAAHGLASNPTEVHPTIIGEHYLADTFLQAMAQDSKPVDKNRRLRPYEPTLGLYMASPTADTAIPATTFTYIDFDSFAAPLGWVYLPATERSYFPQLPGVAELSVTVTFKAPVTAGRYYIDVYDLDTGGTFTVLHDSSLPASADPATVGCTPVMLPVNGVGTRFKVRVYTSVPATVSAGRALTRFQAKFLGPQE